MIRAPVFPGGAEEMFVLSPASRRLVLPKAGRAAKPFVAAAVVALIASVCAPAFADQSAPGAQAKMPAPLLIGLGDSYTSGVGEAQLDPASGVCRRSAQSYPLVAAKTLGMKGLNVACSGAPASAFTQSFREQPPQAQLLGSAQYIVMTIGGNDVLSIGNVSSLVTQDIAKVQASLTQLQPQLATSFAAVKNAAPAAHIMVLAYPDIFPATDTGMCTAAMKPILAKAHQAYPMLNRTIKEQADKAQIQFIDTSAAFQGHDICSQDPWATGVTDPSIALHPNDKGHIAMAAAAVNAIKPLMASPAAVANAGHWAKSAVRIECPACRPTPTQATSI